MLLSLRSKLWGTRVQQSVTGTGATTQAKQTNAGRCLWYSALTTKIVSLGSTIKKLVETEEPQFAIFDIAGEGGTEQKKQQSNGQAHVAFHGAGASVGARQVSSGVAYQIVPIRGVGATLQESGWSTADAEHIDVELEVIAAILAAA
jgi:hypothetical protein